jgi:formamidopyrimidine-DNA glycosylase
MMNGKKGVVKKWLLDQSLVAGVGNIYADEGCFYAGIRPDQRMENLGKKELEQLFEGVIKALKQGVKNRGTSISDFQDAYGHEGKNQELLYVYGRGGEKCMKCERTLKRTVVAGRGTVYCESCQK